MHESIFEPFEKISTLEIIGQVGCYIFTVLLFAGIDVIALLTTGWNIVHYNYGVVGLKSFTGFWARRYFH